jgi:hypothetical protein
MATASGLTWWVVLSPVSFLRCCKRLRLVRAGSGDDLPAGAVTFERGLIRMVRDVRLRDLDPDKRRTTRVLLLSIQTTFALAWAVIAVFVAALAFG